MSVRKLLLKITKVAAIRLFAALICAALFGSAQAAHAKLAEGSLPSLKSGSLYALVVGVSKYRDNKVPKLDLADKDAQDFGSFLNTQTEIFKDIKVTLLLDEKATKLEVEKYLYYTLPKAGKDDTVILFFSGHGAFDPMRPNDFLFLPHDAQTDYLGATAVKMSGLDFLKTVSAERVLIIADACYAGGFSDLKPKSAAPSLDLFLNEIKNSTGRVVITSAKPEQLSWENPKLKNSVFTNSFLEGLRGKADRDQDGIVTLNEAYEYAYNRTKDETGGKQHPQFEGKIVGAFPLSLVGERMPAAELKKKLLKAAEVGDTETLNQLLPRMSEIDTRDGNNNTPLILSSLNSHLEAAKLLLAKGADVDAVDSFKSTSLVYAAEKLNQSLVTLLLSEGAGVKTKNNEGKTALMMAAAGGGSKIVELLLQEGADLRARSKIGDTALSLAAGRSSATVKLLLKWAEDLQIDDINAEGALVNACRNGNDEITRLLIAKNPQIKISGGVPERKLVFAILRGDMKKVRETAEAADIECVTEWGDTPLVLASSLGYSNFVEFLLTKKPAVNRRVGQDRTALMNAAANGHKDVVTILLNGGAEVNAKDRNGAGPLFLSVAAGKIETAKLLLAKGAEINAVNTDGLSPLAKATLSGNLELMKILLAAGADIETRDKSGATPLLQAATQGHFEAAKLLIKRADVNAKNNQKNSALSLAVRNGHKDVIRLLVSHGCDLNARDWEGKTPLNLAVETNRNDIAEIIRSGN